MLSAVGFSVAYQAWFGSFSIDHGINYTDVFNTLSGFFENDTEVVVPAGVGTYRGLQDASEYLIIALQAANMGFWRRYQMSDMTATLSNSQEPSQLHVV